MIRLEHASTSKLRGSPSLSENTKTPHTELPLAPRGGLEASGSKSLVITHRSAPPLGPFPVAPFEPVRTSAGSERGKTKVPAAEPRETFGSETEGSDVTYRLPVRRIMNDGWRGYFPDVLPVVVVLSGNEAGCGSQK